MKKRWVQGNKPGDVDRLEHINGVTWNMAPVPVRWHFCTAWTRGWTGLYDLRYIERCACGAIRLDGQGRPTVWANKNTRRRK